MLNTDTTGLIVRQRGSRSFPKTCLAGARKPGTIGLMAVQLDPGSDRGRPLGPATPLAEQVYAAIERRIAGGTAAREQPTSDHARARGRARDQSRHRPGRLSAAPGRRARRRPRRQRHGRARPAIGGARSASSDLVSRRVAEMPEESSVAPTPPLVADFSRLAPDETFFPLEEFTRTLADAWSRRPRPLAVRSPARPGGASPRDLAGASSRAASRGPPEEILVVERRAAGARPPLPHLRRPGGRRRHGVADVFGRAGAGAVRRGFESCRCRWTPTGRTSRPLHGRRVKLVYVMPERQNPTGITASEERRRVLPEAADVAGALLVEDGYEEPESGIAPLGGAPSGSRRLARHALQGPGAGLPHRLARGAARRSSSGWRASSSTADFQTPLPLQAAIASFLRAGADRKARAARAREVETLRVATAARRSASTCPRFRGGAASRASSLFWLRLPEGVSGRSVAEAAAARGVAVTPGQDFDPEGKDRATLRLSVSRVERDAIEPGSRFWRSRCGKWRRGLERSLSAPVV